MRITKKVYLLVVLLTLQLLLATIGTAQQEEPSWSTYTVELHIGDNLYVLNLWISSTYIVRHSSTFYMNINAKLVYATSSDPLFVSAEVTLSGITLGSYPIGYLSPSNRMAATRITGLVPPHILEDLIGRGNLGFIELRIKGYQGQNSDEEKLLLPIVLVGGEPDLILNTWFEEGGLYTIAIIGEDYTKKLFIEVVNTGETEVYDVKIEVLLDNKLIYSKLLSTLLKPGERTILEVDIPIPLEEGVHIVNIDLRAVIGSIDYEQSKSLVVVSMQKPGVQLILLNTSSTVTEGYSVCFEVQVEGKTSLAEQYIVVESRAKGVQREWTPVYSTKYNSSKTRYCWRAESYSGRITTYIFQAKLVSRIYGAEKIATSNKIEVTVIPIQLLRQITDLQIAATPHILHREDNITVKATLSPQLPGCYSISIEVMREGAWSSIEQFTICSGRGEATIPATAIGEGEYFIRAIVLVEGYSIVSNLVRINVLGEPVLQAEIEPLKLLPSSTVRVKAWIEPVLEDYTITIKPSWLDRSFNLTGTMNKPVIFELEAPNTTGEYTITVEGVYRGKTLEVERKITVFSPKLQLRVEPKELFAGEQDEIRLIVTIEPPIDKTYAVVELLGEEKTIRRLSLEVSGSSTETSIAAPQEPGVYTVKIQLPRYRVENTTTINIKKIVYGVSVELNTTSTTPGSGIDVKVAVHPPPKKPLTLTLMIREPNGTWKPLDTLIVSKSEAKLEIKAPSTPGNYTLKAVLPAVNAESSPVVLQVHQGGRELLPTQTFVTLITGVATLAIAWSIRAIRRR